MAANIFWDRKITKEEVQKILKDESNPRFVEYAALVLSREGRPKDVFDDYLTKMVFIKNWRKIKIRMRKDKWNDNRIAFWDEIYNFLSRGVDKKALKEKRMPVAEEAKRIGEIIKQARKNKEWNQKDLAIKAGISQQSVSFAENGYLNISLMTLKSILDALNLKLSIVHS